MSLLAFQRYSQNLLDNHAETDQALLVTGTKWLIFRISIKRIESLFSPERMFKHGSNRNKRIEKVEGETYTSSQLFENKSSCYY